MRVENEGAAKIAMELGIGEMTLMDIAAELEKPGRDPREEMPRPILRTDVLEIKDLKEGMILKGTVRNVIDFGAFVDIGVHQDGLVHISEMSDHFIKHPLEAVRVGDIVEVRVIGVDVEKKRISLSMKTGEAPAHKPKKDGDKAEEGGKSGQKNKKSGRRDGGSERGQNRRNEGGRTADRQKNPRRDENRPVEQIDLKNLASLMMSGNERTNDRGRGGNRGGKKPGRA